MVHSICFSVQPAVFQPFVKTAYDPRHKGDIFSTRSTGRHNLFFLQSGMSNATSSYMFNSF